MPRPRILSLVVILICLVTTPTARAADFKNWNLLTENGPDGPATAAVFNNWIYVLIGRPLVDIGPNRLYKSPDGIHWTDLGYVPWAFEELYDYKLVVFKHTLVAIVSSENENLEIWTTADGNNWTKLALSSKPSAREDFAITVFQDKLWLSGGYTWADDNGFNDVWCTEDLVNWTLVCPDSGAGWGYSSSMVAFKDRLLIVGYHDMWSSLDGRDWNNLGHVPKKGAYHSTVVWDNKIWIIGGGYNDEDDDDPESDYYDSGETFNSILYTSDGTTWTTVENSDIGPIQEHAAVVMNNRLYVIGGCHWVPGVTDGEEDGSLYDIGKVWVSPDPAYAASAVTSPLEFRSRRRTGQIVTVEIKNTGSSPWSSNTGLGLKLYSDKDEIWASTTSTLALTQGTTVNPGQSFAFKVPVDLSDVWSNTEVRLRMYQPDVGAFGDTVTLSFNMIWDHPIKWHQIENNGKILQEYFEDYYWNDGCPATSVSDKGLLVQNWQSLDGNHWMKMSDLGNVPWNESDGNKNFNGQLIQFKNKVYAISEKSIWKTGDGMNWSRSGAPWPKLNSRIIDDYMDQYDGTPMYFPPIVSSCCIFNDKLYAMITYDMDNEVFDNRTVIWNSSDGTQWSKLGEFNEQHSYGKMVSFQNKIWVFGGTWLDYETEQFDGYTYTKAYPSHLIYSTSDGKKWDERGWIDHLENVTVYHDKIWAITESNQFMVSTDGVNWEPSTPITADPKVKIWGLCTFDDRLWVLYGSWYRNGYELYEPGFWCGSEDDQNAMSSTTRIDFGRRELFSPSSSAQSLNVYNCGLSPLRFTGAGAEIISSRPREFSFSPKPNTNPINVSRTIAVTFTPSRVGPTSATLQITTGDPVHPTLKVKLLGEGISTQPLKSGNILAYLLGHSNDSTNLDQNADTRVDIADYIHILNSPIEVTTPALGNTKYLGQNMPIRWNTKTSIGSVKLELVRNHEPVKTITASTSNDGSYDWTIDSVLIPDSNYSVIVTNAADATIKGESKFFNIAAQGNDLSMQYPDGGEKFNRGDKIPIHWNFLTSNVKKIRIDLYRKDAFYKTLVTSRASSDGDIYAWTIPSDSITGGSFRIVVMDAENPSIRAASGIFAISK